MKKTLALFSAGVLLASALVSCGASGSSSQSEPATENTTAANVTEEPAGPSIMDEVVGKKWFLKGQKFKDGKRNGAPEQLCTTYLTFSASGIVDIHEEIIYSDYLNLSDEYLMIDDNEYKYTYDGRALVCDAGNRDITFKRVGLEDKTTVYGRFSCKEKFGSAQTQIYFVASGKSVLIDNKKGTYTFDPSSNKITINMQGETSPVVYTITSCEGSELKLTDEKETVGVYTALDKFELEDYNSVF
ncbi:MAG: hypothetical protein IKO47_04695 [Ruminococcus sp.]|nr:hypothetical protein [Ruminococcus sp.]